MSLLGPIADIAFEIVKTTVSHTVNGVKAGASVVKAAADTGKEVAKAAGSVVRPK